MDRVIELLQRKNHYLEKFLLISEAEMLNFENGDFDNLESFYACREKILNIINYIEKELDSTNSQFSDSHSVSDEHRRKVAVMLDRRDSLVNDILNFDLKIIACIDQEKTTIIKDLQEVKKGKRAVGGYRSSSMARPRLNEEI